MANTTYDSTEDVISKLQQFKGKTKLKYEKNMSKYYNILNIRMDEDPFAKNARDISKIYLEVLLLMNFLQTKPKVKSMNIKYYVLFFTVNKNRDDNEL